ncbi:hypothetical protein TRVA0_062S00606 [Trichomonascus vanleenenianus]|uniref:WD40 repeat domain-containing protein n=1 Tax=Trichomonascus vanleenenianus TaxID=2268995 RepID=UPI003ECA551D
MSTSSPDIAIPELSGSNALRFAFSYPSGQVRLALPHIAVSYDDEYGNEALILAYASGAIDVYDSKNHLTTRIELYGNPDSAQLPQGGENAVISVLKAVELRMDNVAGTVKKALLVGYSTGDIATFILPEGKLHAQRSTGSKIIDINANCDPELLMVWGEECSFQVLDSSTLETKYVINQLRDWPMAVSLFDNKVLLAFKDGGYDQLRIWPHTIEKLSKGEFSGLFSPQGTTDEAYHQASDIDLIVDVQKVGPISWVVLQRSGWTLYRWEDDQLVKQIGSNAEVPLIGLIFDKLDHAADREHRVEEQFGILSSDDSIMWVHQSNVQLLVPAWDIETTEVIQVMFQPKAKRLVLLAMDQRGIILRWADTSATQIQWNDEVEVLEPKKSQVHKSFISAVHGSDIIIAENGVLTLYTLGEFLTSFEQVKPLITLNSGKFTAIESTSQTISYIVTGTSEGKLLSINKETGQIIHNVSLFASSTLSCLRFPSIGGTSNSRLAGEIVAVSRNATVSVIDLISGVKRAVIPGNNNDITRMYRVMSDKKETGIVISYESGEARAWNLDSGGEMDSNIDAYPERSEIKHLYPRSDAKDRVYPLTSVDPAKGPYVFADLGCIVEEYGRYLDEKLESPHMINEIKALVNAIVPIDENRATKHWQRCLYIKTTSDTKIVIGRAGYVGPYINVSFINNGQSSDNEVLAASISVWIVLIKVVLHAESIDVPTSRILTWLTDLITFDTSDVSGFATLASNCSNPFIRRVARQCVKELVGMTESSSGGHSSSDKSATHSSRATKLINEWEPNLPSRNTQEMYGDKSLQAIEILSPLCIAKLGKNRLSAATDEDRQSYDNLARQVAESLQIYLTGDAPDENRDTAIVFIGKGWGVWQKYFNPIAIISALVQLLCKHGYCTKDLDDPVVAMCLRCINGIAVQNSRLLVSTLLLLLGPDTHIDERVCSIRLISGFMASAAKAPSQKDEADSIGRDLLTIVSSIVKLLDPNDPSLKELAPLSSTSLMSEATQFLSSSMNAFPALLAFHKGQQRLAVASPDAARLIGFVYDLRTGTIIASLTAGSDVLAAHKLTAIAFSPDGKQLAGVIDSSRVAVWKLGAGIMSLLQSLSISSHDASSARDGLSTVEPKEAHPGKSYEWTNTNDIKIA